MPPQNKNQKMTTIPPSLAVDLSALQMKRGSTPLFLNTQACGMRPHFLPTTRPKAIKPYGGLTIAGWAEAQTMDKTMLNTTPLNEAQRESVAAALNSIRSSLGFLVGLRPSDKQRLLKMGNKNRVFVEDAIKAGVSNPSMLPRSIEPETLQDKLTLFGQLREVQSDLQQVTELVNNTVTVMGSELYEDARLIYSLTKTKVQASGLNTTSASLSKRFAGQGRRSADKTEDKAPLMQ